MKLMFASDIHGSEYYCRMMIQSFKRENPDRLILLGDILYHGPRNDLPKGYLPKAVAGMLCDISDRILCVRGNCDSEVDAMVLNFPILADYALIYADEVPIYITHGHIFTEDNPPKFPPSSSQILLCGHTHVPKAAEHDGYVYLNTGSVSIPKENSPHSYVIYENGCFKWINLESDSQEFMEYRI